MENEFVALPIEKVSPKRKSKFKIFRKFMSSQKSEPVQGVINEYQVSRSFYIDKNQYAAPGVHLLHLERARSTVIQKTLRDLVDLWSIKSCEVKLRRLNKHNIPLKHIQSPLTFRKLSDFEKPLRNVSGPSGKFAKCGSSGKLAKCGNSGIQTQFIERY